MCEFSSYKYAPQKEKNCSCCGKTHLLIAACHFPPLLQEALYMD